MIHNIIGGGGGGGINLKVVGGTTQPAGKENTIWVNTPTDINGYAVSATAPSSPASGMVWLKTGTNAPAPINVGSKNAVTIYPTNCYQYISDSWVSKTAMTYVNGAWVNWTVYLYNNGDLCSDVIGEWIANNLGVSGATIAAKTPVNTAEYLELSSGWQGSGYDRFCAVRNSKLLSRTGQTTLDFEIEPTGYAGNGTPFFKVRLIDSAGAVLAESDSYSVSDKTKRTGSIPISAISSSFYVSIYFHVFTNSEVGCKLYSMSMG